MQGMFCPTTLKDDRRLYPTLRQRHGILRRLAKRSARGSTIEVDGLFATGSVEALEGLLDGSVAAIATEARE